MKKPPSFFIILFIAIGTIVYLVNSHLKKKRDLELIRKEGFEAPGVVQWMGTEYDESTYYYAEFGYVFNSQYLEKEMEVTSHFFSRYHKGDTLNLVISPMNFNVVLTKNPKHMPGNYGNLIMTFFVGIIVIGMLASFRR